MLADTTTERGTFKGDGDQRYAAEVGIHTDARPSTHRESEYDSAGLDVLLRMQRDHFWYRGRHRFIRHAVRRYVRRFDLKQSRLDVVDLGGGCGGWIDDCRRHRLLPDANCALADSSNKALELARPVVGQDVRRYQINLLDLRWHDRWDIAFLLDVLEHIPNEERALRQIYQALRPGGLLFITTPVLRCFWTWNDEVAHHQRRYSKADFRRLAERCGLELLDARYFMFVLSPLLLAARWTKRPDLAAMTPEAVTELQARTHRVPHPAINRVLQAVFDLETPLGHFVPFPWGTSILAVLRKRPHHDVESN
jgi:2-polyprenyl-3-methyl-5-hydroxy-6-metoxy-1,4-benzoquinol methylase